MSKTKRIYRVYFIPALATVTAIVFWWVFREGGTFYWWIGLVALILLAHYLAFWKSEKLRKRLLANGQFEVE